MSDVYIGPIEHDPLLCRPDRCPGDYGCWCAACERGNHTPEAPDPSWTDGPDGYIRAPLINEGTL